MGIEYQQLSVIGRDCLGLIFEFVPSTEFLNLSLVSKEWAYEMENQSANYWFTQICHGTTMRLELYLELYLKSRERVQHRVFRKTFQKRWKQLVKTLKDFHKCFLDCGNKRNQIFTKQFMIERINRDFFHLFHSFVINFDRLSCEMEQNDIVNHIIYQNSKLVSEIGECCLAYFMNRFAKYAKNHSNEVLKVNKKKLEKFYNEIVERARFDPKIIEKYFLNHPIWKITVSTLYRIYLFNGVETTKFFVKYMEPPTIRERNFDRYHSLDFFKVVVEAVCSRSSTGVYDILDIDRCYDNIFELWDQPQIKDFLENHYRLDYLVKASLKYPEAESIIVRKRLNQVFWVYLDFEHLFNIYLGIFLRNTNLEPKESPMIVKTFRHFFSTSKMSSIQKCIAFIRQYREGFEIHATDFGIDDAMVLPFRLTSAVE